MLIEEKLRAEAGKGGEQVAAAFRKLDKLMDEIVNEHNKLEAEIPNLLKEFAFGRCELAQIRKAVSICLQAKTILDASENATKLIKKEEGELFLKPMRRAMALEKYRPEFERLKERLRETPEDSITRKSIRDFARELGPEEVAAAEDFINSLV